MHDRTECTLNKLADDTIQGRVAEMPEGCAVIQSDLDRLEKWADRNIIKFNRGKLNRENFKVLHLERNNLRHHYTLCTKQRECCLTERDLGSQLVTKLNMKQQCTLVSKQAHGILAVITQSRSREMIFPLYSALVKPQLGFWAFQYKRDMVILVTVRGKGP